MKHRDRAMHNENGQHSERCELLTDVVDNACERLQLLQVRVRDGRGETLAQMARSGSEPQVTCERVNTPSRLCRNAGPLRRLGAERVSTAGKVAAELRTISSDLLRILVDLALGDGVLEHDDVA